MTEHQPSAPAIFRCNKCDRVEVDSQKPETGKFYLQWGHAFNSQTKLFDGEYTGVMFAVCRECGS